MSEFSILLLDAVAVRARPSRAVHIDAMLDAMMLAVVRG